MSYGAATCPASVVKRARDILQISPRFLYYLVKKNPTEISYFFPRIPLISTAAAADAIISAAAEAIISTAAVAGHDTGELLSSTAP